VTDKDQDVNSFTSWVQVEINLLPNASFTINSTLIFISQAVNVTFNGLEGNQPSTISWDFGDGTAKVYNTTTLEHVYSTIGIKTINLTIIDRDLEQTSNVLVVTVENDFIPNATFNILTTAPFTVGKIIQFNIVNAGGNLPLLFFWKFGDGSNSTSISPNHSYLTAGIYNVSLELQDRDGDIHQSTQILTIYANDSNSNTTSNSISSSTTSSGSSTSSNSNADSSNSTDVVQQLSKLFQNPAFLGGVGGLAGLIILIALIKSLGGSYSRVKKKKQKPPKTDDKSVDFKI
jgi:PKD repeat protein